MPGVSIEATGPLAQDTARGDEPHVCQAAGFAARLAAPPGSLFRNQVLVLRRCCEGPNRRLCLADERGKILNEGNPNRQLSSGSWSRFSAKFVTAQTVFTLNRHASRMRVNQVSR